MHQPLQKFIHGYAQLLDTPVDNFFKLGITFIETPVRDLPEWANWIQPIWLFGYENAVICSVSPTYAEAAQSNLATVTADTLLSDTTLARATAIAPDHEWVRCELFYYPHTEPPQPKHPYTVKMLQPGQPDAEQHLRNFDGGVYVIWGSNNEITAQEITAAAFIKNKGIIREIAVSTEEAYRRQGRAQAVVAHAIQEILAQGHIPTYWPDSFDNKGSYAVAESVGMTKAAEMLFCSYPLAEWEGFQEFE